jgi:hypothetical protein
MQAKSSDIADGFGHNFCFTRDFDTQPRSEAEGLISSKIPTNLQILSSYRFLRQSPTQLGRWHGVQD